RLSEYQANNLAQFLWAVVEHPKDEIGSWNTGDWWGEIAFMLQELADKNKGNRGPGK
ncbi:MAG: hypothetical protein JWO59_674, partial [Chloroflexi bacterium]|nr:hypothetical protein [Chloroflexota bacterium]